MKITIEIDKTEGNTAIDSVMLMKERADCLQVFRETQEFQAFITEMGWEELLPA